ncbi:(p)ppGpp synthetase [Aeromonas salmonicida subsp. salmonicida]|uniref:GTP pyrophosphokinase n=2 Tax=Aeromonas salmonicida subsp. salmonicida TaxID=29491 RepID=A4SRC4_AERS4|nr:GTP diphosphokinase [Aeromonas salmonicida]ABO91446.1 GTP pyrophosphokinase [Aeromonas salmonicida subsp. salmonicida A449]AYO64452.1 GTP diphosphokinase [Aeromonas salmonicida subsp. salmonicida 01-B526]EHI51128.1 GTP pyrophosphokinase [Aeromonas salmonicida subsp. salmonicida 01-B526]EKP0240631.1 GTP diphosphokinase [Aeromonas salmonicida]EKP0244858.1 GTP diphosphokinase [Aeromonas salmonicida]
MVAVRDIHLKDNFTLEEWVSSLSLSDSDKDQLRTVYQYCLTLGDEAITNRLLVRGVEMAGILLMLSMDLGTLKAAIIYPFVEAGLISQERMDEDFGPKIAKLVEGVLEMEAIRSLQTLHRSETSPEQVDNVRRMLLAMVEDVRAVVIKLAERIACLREAKKADEETRVLMAQEITNIYAPLANRLGIGQLKWELEDLAFRYLHPDTYKQIAKQLDEKRLDRERYIREFVQSLRDGLKEAGVEAEVYGRPKHIYSIWRKMQKKHLEFNELFDVRAVRVVTKRLQDCYAALGIVHTHFHHIPREFDDYVANPKPNGYQSIHTVVVGPEGKTVEIQIRTDQMHQDAELGVAAHWRYKEGAQAANKANKANNFEDKIEWLRKLLAWQEDLSESGSLLEDLRSQVFEDRVYVFTPKGDVIDLPAGATPLDFAYHVHSMIGHRCIGAKIDGRIVPFTYALQTGDQVEVITQKEPNPSRDWMNPNSGFLRSSRARAKVATWFRKLDKDKNIAAGKELLEKELDRHNLTLSKVDKVVLERFHAEELEDLLAGIGSGDIRINQLLNYLDTRYNKPTAEEEDRRVLEKLEQKANTPFRPKPKDHIVVEGVGNLMTHIARCCQPIPGDTIQGFITMGRGVSIHRDDCEQLKELSRRNPERLIDAVWGENYSGGYGLTIRILSNDRSGLLRDITTVLANEKINVMGVRSRSNVREQTAEIDMELEIYNINAFNRALAKLSQLNDVISAKRL